jgi:hypothetical protein
MNNDSMSEYRAFSACRLRKDLEYCTDIKEIAKAYKEWTEYAKCMRGITTKKLTMIELCKYLQEEFGKPLNERIFRCCRVFSDAESVDKFDKERE